MNSDLQIHVHSFQFNSSDYQPDYQIQVVFRFISFVCLPISLPCTGRASAGAYTTADLHMCTSVMCMFLVSLIVVFIFPTD